MEPGTSRKIEWYEPMWWVVLLVKIYYAISDWIFYKRYPPAY